MKKILLIVFVYLAFTTFSLIVLNDSREKFYLLNWGEYIDPSLVEQFENENNISVVMDEVSSSEDMYQKISTGTTKYDIAIPGDYIIEKLYTDDYLLEIDVDKVDNEGNLLMPNYHDGMFQSDLEHLRETQFFEGNQKYCMPYFWGAYAIIYSTINEGVEKAVQENGFDVFFNRSLLPSNAKVGMYDVARWTVTCYLLNNNLDINMVDLSSISTPFINQVSQAKYDLWGNDILKKQIGDGNLDIAFVQLGDFFDQYYLKNSSFEDVNFNCYIPDNTAAFFDGMVIPKTTENYDMALRFINFFLDETNSFENASYVGYCPTINGTIDLIKESEDFTDIVEEYPFYLNPLAGKNASLFRDLGSDYASNVIELVNRAKNRN